MLIEEAEFYSEGQLFSWFGLDSKTTAAAIA